MAVKLTKAQHRALKLITERDGFFSAHDLGTQTCEALRERGLLEGERPFTGRFGNNPQLWLTPAGRQALKEQSL